MIHSIFLFLVQRTIQSLLYPPLSDKRLPEKLLNSNKKNLYLLSIFLVCVIRTSKGCRKPASLHSLHSSRMKKIRTYTGPIKFGIWIFSPAQYIKKYVHLGNGFVCQLLEIINDNNIGGMEVLRGKARLFTCSNGAAILLEKSDGDSRQHKQNENTGFSRNLVRYWRTSIHLLSIKPANNEKNIRAIFFFKIVSYIYLYIFFSNNKPGKEDDGKYGNRAWSHHRKKS